MPPRRIRAQWVLTVEGRAIERGAVLLDSAGRIAAVGPEVDVPLAAGAADEDFGQAAVLPGLVNVHTHLELTGLDGLAPEADFPSWIRRVTRLVADRSFDESLAAARQGVQDGWRAGVTTVADTGATGAVIQTLAELGGSGIAYLEVFGPDPRVARTQFDRWQSRLEALRRYATGRVALGVSPHAPYSVSGPLYRLVAEYAAAEKFPIAVHVAESADESALLATGEGGFADNWRSRSIPVEPPGVTPLAWLERHGVLGSRTLCIHVVRAGAEDLRLLAGHDAAVAHCPRSNARHGHGAAPLRDLLALGIRTGVGTDSVVSVSPLDLLAEARAAQQLAGLEARRALRLCTLDAARALGLDREIGSLVPGKWGDIAVVRLPQGVDESRLADTLLTRGTGQIAATFLAGKEVWRGTL